MTPKEKATSIVDTMYLIISNNGQFTGEHSIPFKFEEAKKCALICCDEVLGYMGADRGYQFWSEVKQEIEKL
jgi:hypothetical protein